MQETKLKRLTLFLLESIILQGDRIPDASFIIQFNDFVYQYFEEYQELFSVIYEPALLKEFKKNNYEILSLEQAHLLFKRCKGFEGYSDLLDAVGAEVDKKLIQLATLFTEYYQELEKLYYADDTNCYSKVHLRILQ